jgi:hypothetical protein
MKDPNDLSVTVLANPVQAETLAWMFHVTPPSRRLSVAAAFLGVYSAEIFRAAGMTDADRTYYAHGRRRGGRLDLPSMVMLRLSRVLGVPFGVLWDDEALEAPILVLQAMSFAGTGVKHGKSKVYKRDGAGDSVRALRLAAG